MATLRKALTYFASFILCLLLAGCGVNSDVGVDQEPASNPEVPEQTPAPESNVATAAVSEVSLVQPVVSPTELEDHAVDLVEPITFTVVTYNVENLFDVDGVSIFDDYKLNSGYTPRK